MTGSNRELATLTADALTAGYRSGELSPVDVVTQTIERAVQAGQDYNCFYALDTEGALSAARASAERWERRAPLGPLDGVPSTVKENIALAGFPQPQGSAVNAEVPPAAQDGPAAARLRAAGSPIVGITVMPDFGMLSSGVSSLHGITRSPWNPAWTVGGSSGGAGAAAAAGVGPLHVGSDIGGSLRLPASWLGLVTLKPSFGRVPVDPPYMGRAVGPLTRTVRDAALMMQVLSQPDSRDYTALPPTRIDWDEVTASESAQSLAGLRIGYHVSGGAGLPTDPEVTDRVEAAAEHFRSAGAEVSKIAPPMTALFLDSLDMFLRTRLLADLERLTEAQQEQVLPFVLQWAQGARALSGTEVLRHYGTVQELRRATLAATADFDLVLSPVAPVAAFPAEWPMPSNDPATSLHHIAYTAPYNFSEQPASSINCGFTRDGRPVGLQIAGRRFADLEVLRATQWYEQTRPGDATPNWPR